MSKFRGIWPALLTPYDVQGDVNLPVLRELIEYLLDKQVDGFYVCGTTGEGLWLSVPERKAVTEAVLDQVHGRVPVIVHVGTVATRDAVLLAEHARDAGASGVSSVLPPVRRQVESIYLHYETIAHAVPELPFLVYVFGGETDAVSLLCELLKRIPNLGGAKYTGPNMYEFRHIVELRDEDWTAFSGMDEQCLFAAMFGASGNIGSTLNFMPGVYREIHRSYQAGALLHAQDLQLRANRVTRVLHSFGSFGAMRAIMYRLGFDCGEPRLPNVPLAPEKYDLLCEALDMAGFAELAAL
ncbi:MAG: dihydrodipicolinate synthase family protein [Anaerolineae bacterium]|nr:dihydrodipicolinate synthase family protein [Anaerolineae bacterium]